MRRPSLSIQVFGARFGGADFNLESIRRQIPDVDGVAVHIDGPPRYCQARASALVVRSARGCKFDCFSDRLPPSLQLACGFVDVTLHRLDSVHLDRLQVFLEEAMGHSMAEKAKTHERIMALASKRFREKGIEGSEWPN